MRPYDEWLEMARSCYNLAKAHSDDYVRYADKCYLLQQAVEKAFKGLLIYYQVEPAYTHVISVLLDEIENYTEVSSEVKDSVQLTHYAVQTRYSGNLHNVSEEDYHEALQITKNCINWVENKIKKTD